MPKVSLCYSMHKAGNVAMPSIQATRAGHCCAFRKCPGFPSLNVRQLYAEPRISRDQGRRSRPDSLCRAGAPQRLRSIRRPRAEHTETRRQVSMPQSEQCVAVGPTVVSASAKSTPKVCQRRRMEPSLSRIACCSIARMTCCIHCAQVKAYWGKTIPVIPVTPTVPVSLAVMHHTLLFCADGRRHMACIPCRHGTVWAGTTNTFISQTPTTALQQLRPALQVMHNGICCIPCANSACSMCITPALPCQFSPDQLASCMQSIRIECATAHMLHMPDITLPPTRIAKRNRVHTGGHS